MFDIFQVVDLYKKNRQNQFLKSFNKNPYYSDIQFKESKLNLENSFFCYLERDETKENYFRQGGTHFIIYGSVYSNNKYCEQFNTNNKKLIAKDIAQFYTQFNVELTSYIKGSYVLIIYDDEAPSVKVITDKLNVLPLYYSFIDGLFFISSSVSLLKSTTLIGEQIDEFAITSQLLFDYVVGTRTFYKNIKQTGPGRIYQINDDELTYSEYWGAEALYHKKLLGKKESLKLMSEQLSNNVQLYSLNTKKLLVSLTGGFDGRTNVAMLQKDKDDFLCYSYGMSGSKQIEVPKLISKAINIKYKSILLNDEFEKDYIKNAENVIEFSNGTAPIIRANYPFAYKKLRNYSTSILTGLFGSEVLRPIHTGLGIFTNNLVEELLLTKDFSEAKENVFNKLIKRNYINKDILLRNYEKVISLVENYRNKYSIYGKEYPYFFFQINEGIRKYFMQEIQIERVYVTTLLSYWDDDFIDLVYRTPFAGMYNGFIKKSKTKRRKGQLLYAHIIKKFNPELGKIVLDRGYKPNDLIKPFPFNYLFLFIGVMKARKYMKNHKGNDTFNSEKWTKEMIEKSLKKHANPSEIFGKGMIENFKNGEYLNDLLKYSHMISLLNYFNK